MCDTPDWAARGHCPGVCVDIPAIGERHSAILLTHRPTPGKAAEILGRRGEEGGGCPQLGTPESPRSGGFGKNHSLEVERGGEALNLEPRPPNQFEPPLYSFSRSSLTFAVCSANNSSPSRNPGSRAPLVAPRPPPPARGPAVQASSHAQVIKAGLRQLTADPSCPRRSPGRAAPGTGKDPGPEMPSSHPCTPARCQSRSRALCGA